MTNINKPCSSDSDEDCRNCLEERISLADNGMICDEWGDSGHYDRRQKV